MKPVIPSTLLALFLAACGGGEDLAPALANASLQGTVYEVDGQTVDRSGVLVTMLETGETALTGVDGEFRFGDLGPGSYTLDFGTSVRSFAQLTANAGSEGEGEGEGTDTGTDTGTGEDAEEQELEEDEHEDEQGHPRIEIDEDCRRIEIRVAVENGKVKEFDLGEHGTRHAMASLLAAEGSEIDLEGKIRITASGERELFKINVAPLDAGTVIELYLDDREGDDGAVSIGTALADGSGVATYLRDTGDGQSLPGGAERLEDLAGQRIEMRLASSDDPVLVGEVPELPVEDDRRCSPDDSGEGDEPEADEESEEDGEGMMDGPIHEGSRRGKALLESEIDGIEGHIAIRSWPAEEIERFYMDIAGLEPGDRVAFEIVHPESEEWTLLGIRIANDDGVARIDTDNDLELPFDVESIDELSGLRVRIRRHEEDNDEVLMGGRVPETVRD